MPVFTYRARERSGRLVEGTMEADSERAVVTQLRERGLLPTILHEQVFAPSVGTQVQAMTGVGRQDLVLFTRQLATMISGGLALVGGLEVTARQTDSRRLRAVLDSVREGIEAGGTLSAELAKHPVVFSNLYISIVQAGEIAGALDRVLLYLADYLERELDLIQRVKTTSMYPLIVLGSAVAVGFVSVFVVLPTLVGLFKGLSIPLPWPTRALIFVSTASSRFWYVLLATPVVLVATYVAMARNKRGRAVLDRILLRTPIVGRLILKVSLARLARMFAMITRSGVPLLQGMEVVGRSAGNAVIANAVDAAARLVGEGQSIATALSQFPVFPPMLWRMIAVGEQTGALENVLDKVADFYDRDVDNTVRRFAAIVEPVMIIGVGGIVAFVAVAMLLPLWQLIGALH